MPSIGIGVLQDSYRIGENTWTKVNRAAQPVSPDYKKRIDEEKTRHPVVQYNLNGDGTMHMSIHSGFAGAITNVHYTNGKYNNAKIHYNLINHTFSADLAQIGDPVKKGFSREMGAMQLVLIAFLVHTQIDPHAMNNLAIKDKKYLDAEKLKDQKANWGTGRKGKRGTTYSIAG